MGSSIDPAGLSRLSPVVMTGYLCYKNKTAAAGLRLGPVLRLQVVCPPLPLDLPLPVMQVQAAGSEGRTYHGGKLRQRRLRLQPARDGAVLLLHIGPQHFLEERQQAADHRHVSNGRAGAHLVGGTGQAGGQGQKLCYRHQVQHPWREGATRRASARWQLPAAC